MSWLAKLSETYDACFGREQFQKPFLTPLGSVPQTTQVLIQLHGDGTFLSAKLDELDETSMFVTEDSASRSGSKPAANPLTEQLEYCAKGIEQYGGDGRKFQRYLELLRKWVNSRSADAKVSAILTYVEAGTLLGDLLREGVLVQDGLTLSACKIGKSGKVEPNRLWIRWSVTGTGRQADTWSDSALAASWAAFECSLSQKTSVCMLEGLSTRTTQKHPKRIRYGGDNAKLISSNDDSGFTYLGRFTSSEQALTVGYEATQKAHNALRWLIARQGARQGDQVIVSWAVAGSRTPPLLVSSEDLFFDEEGDAPTVAPEPVGYGGDAGQAFALRLKQAVQGYRSRIDDTTDIVVMALDSATPGRMAILYYRELESSEFLARIERWHTSLAWPQNFGKDRQFTGAPAPRDIAEAAYGSRCDEKLRKATVERLLPCIVDGRPLPRDLEQAVVRRAANCAGLERWEWERVLGVACSLVRGTHPEMRYEMSLEETRFSRDYLYGRLLAVADSIEEIALSVARENRETNAARLMQRFADHPYTTWRTLELQLRPYIARLRGSRYAGALVIRQKLLDALIDSFPLTDSGENSFTDNRRLSGEFLLGYHSQRAALRAKKQAESETEELEGVPQ